MSLKKKIAKITGVKESLIPAGYQILGNVLLIKFSKISPDKKKKIADALMKLLPYIRTVCEIKEVFGELREPDVTVIAGSGTVTTHKENDILYRIDVSKIMFSKGNLYERKRLLGQVQEGETVVDMFAGIGYFTLPIAKFTKAKEIIAIEKNSTAYNFLTENIQLNKVNNVVALQGDCKLAAQSLHKKADRILMGYFPDTEQFLPAAIWMAKPGCMIHFHNVYFEKDIWKNPIETIKLICEKFNRKYEIITKKKVKSYGPRKWHVVIDFRVV